MFSWVRLSLVRRCRPDGLKLVLFADPVYTSSLPAVKKGGVGMSKEELTLEKRRELERRLQDVSGQLNSVKKPSKPKGERHFTVFSFSCSFSRAERWFLL